MKWWCEFLTLLIGFSNQFLILNFSHGSMIQSSYSFPNFSDWGYQWNQTFSLHHEYVTCFTMWLFVNKYSAFLASFFYEVKYLSYYSIFQELHLKDFCEIRIMLNILSFPTKFEYFGSRLQLILSKGATKNWGTRTFDPQKL